MAAVKGDLLTWRR